MQVEHYIKELLLFQDCVIVPGLGAFVSNYQPAQQSEGKFSNFLPPAKRIVFNQKLKHNDGSLVEFVSRQEMVSYEVARAKVEAYVQSAVKSLNEGNLVVLTGLGVLSTIKNGYIRFDQSNEENLLLDSFGLAQFQVQTIEHKTVERRLTPKVIRRLSIAASVAVLIALIPTGVYTKIDTASFNIFEHKAVVTAPVAEHKVEASSADSEIVAKLEEQTEKSAALMYVENREEKTVVADQKHTYSIVIGCYTDEKHIQKAIEEASAAGFEAAVLKPENDYCTYKRVSVGAFSSRKAADSVLASVKANYKDAWVLAN